MIFVFREKVQPLKNVSINIIVFFYKRHFAISLNVGGFALEVNRFADSKNIEMSATEITVF